MSECTWLPCLNTTIFYHQHDNQLEMIKAKWTFFQLKSNKNRKSTLNFKLIWLPFIWRSYHAIDWVVCFSNDFQVILKNMVAPHSTSMQIFQFVFVQWVSGAIDSAIDFLFWGRGFEPRLVQNFLFIVPAITLSRAGSRVTET